MVDFLPAVEVFAETRFEVNNERSSLTYQWEGYGLWLQLPEGATASFTIRAVWSSRFELPEGTELVSPVYWVSYKGEVGGPVGVELQHCAHVREEGQRSGLSFAVCKMENALPPYQFVQREGQFSRRSSYGRMEMAISSTLVAIVRRVKQPTSDPMFLAKLYYKQQQQQQQSPTIAHTVMVPQLDMTTKVCTGMCHNRTLASYIMLKPL